MSAALQGEVLSMAETGEESALGPVPSMALPPEHAQGRRQPAGTLELVRTTGPRLLAVPLSLPAPCLPACSRRTQARTEPGLGSALALQSLSSPSISLLPQMRC